MVRAEDVWSSVEVKCGQVIFEGRKKIRILSMNVLFQYLIVCLFLMINSFRIAT